MLGGKSGQGVVVEFDLAWSAARRIRVRNGAVLAGSLVLHAAIFAALGWPIGARFLDLSNDEDAITVTLQRREVPQRATPQPATSVERQAAAAPLQPHAPRQAPPAFVQPLGVAPRPGPTAPPSGPAQAQAPGGPRGDLKAALRASAAGCANADAVGLNRREREHCNEKFGAMARNAPVYDAPMDPRKRDAFEQQAIRQQMERAQRDAPMGVGVDHRSREGPGTAKEIPWVLGAEQDGLGNPRSAASRRLKQLNDARKADARRAKTARETQQP
jgi:hypothetical protein